MQRLVLILVIVLPLLAALALGAQWWIAIPADAQATYVGRTTCAQCHAPQERLWTGSPHDRALDLATPQSVLGNFDNQELTYQGVTSKMFRRGEKFMVRTEGADGRLADFEVKYVIGYDPLQQYMVEFPDGRVQVLRLSWDVAGRRWFNQYPPDVPNERLKPDDPLHWTGPAMNWNHMCADCHSTDLQKNFDVAANRYHTTFAEIDVSCESCHGPGSIHVEAARRRSPFWDRNHGFGLAKLKGGTSKNQIEACAKCHSRRRMVHADFRPGTELLDFYAPQALDENVYHADGQILDEDYEYGSFVQSRMFTVGVRCTDCHDPHTTRTLHAGNLVCTSCHQHPAAKYDVPAHHHHQSGSSGASCVNCHMPSTHYMILDARRDHSLRAPRPDLSVALGTPNACTACHLELERADKKPQPGAEKTILPLPPGEGRGEGKPRKDPHPSPLPKGEGTGDKHHRGQQPQFPLHYADHLAAAKRGDAAAAADILRLDRWAQKSTEQWYGPRRDRVPHFALALSAAWQHRPEAELALAKLVRQPAYPAIVRATAAGQLGQFDGTTADEALLTALADQEPLVRSAAVGVVASRRRDAANLVDSLAPLLADPVRLVRTEAARGLVPYRDKLSAAQQKSFAAAIREYRQGQLANSDQSAAHANLAALSEALGRTNEAEQSYLTAIRLDRQFFPAQFNLAILYNGQKKKAQAEKLLRGILAEAGAMTDPQHLLRPVQVEAHYLLGLLLNEKPDGAADAERELLAALKLEPERTDVLYALATFGAEHRQWAAAERFARRLVALHPDDENYQQILKQVRAARAATEVP